MTNYYDNVPGAGFFLGNAFVPGGIYKYSVAGLTYLSDLSKKLSGSVQFGAGTFYDGTFHSATFASYLRPSNKVSFDLFWDWNRVDVPFDNGKFTTNILSARFNYSFTTNLFVKTYVQWSDFSNRITSNLLLNFIHSPGSGFFLVYNEEWDTRGGFNTANRTLLAKVTYLLNL